MQQMQIIYHNEHLDTLMYVLSQENVKALVNIEDDADTHTIDYNALKQSIANRSDDESFLIRLAMSLVGMDKIKVDLSRIDQLSDDNRQVAITAVLMRFDLI